MHQTLERQLPKKKSLNNIIANLKELMEETSSKKKKNNNNNNNHQDATTLHAPTPPPETEPHSLVSSLIVSDPDCNNQANLLHVATSNETEDEEMMEDSEEDGSNLMTEDLDEKEDSQLTIRPDSKLFSILSSGHPPAAVDMFTNPVAPTSGANLLFAHLPNCQIASISPTPSISQDLAGPSHVAKRIGKTNVYQGLYPIAEVKHLFRKETIDNETRYTCLWSKCNFSTKKYSQHISRHIHLKHIGIKELKCSEPGCNKIFKRPESLVQHQKNHICGFGIDNERVKDPNNLCGAKNINRHFKRIKDNDIFIYQCLYGGCIFATSNSGSIRRHVHNQHVCPNSASANALADISVGDEEDEEGDIEMTNQAELCLRHLAQQQQQQEQASVSGDGQLLFNPVVQWFESKETYDPESKTNDADRQNQEEQKQVNDWLAHSPAANGIGSPSVSLMEEDDDKDNNEMNIVPPIQNHGPNFQANQASNNRSNGMYSLKNFKGFYRKDRGGEGTVFICLKCEREGKIDHQFKTQISLVRHFWEENGFSNFQCEICQLKLENEFSLYKHRKTEHSNAPPPQGNEETSMLGLNGQQENVQRMDAALMMNHFPQLVPNQMNQLDPSFHTLEQLQQLQLTQQWQALFSNPEEWLKFVICMNQQLQQANMLEQPHPATPSAPFMSTGRVSPAESSSSSTTSSASLSIRTPASLTIASLSPGRETSESNLQKLLKTSNSSMDMERMLSAQPSPPAQLWISTAGSAPTTSLKQYRHLYDCVSSTAGNVYRCKLCRNYEVRTPVSMSKHLRNQHREIIETLANATTQLEPSRGQERETSMDGDELDEDEMIDVEHDHASDSAKQEPDASMQEAKPKRRPGHGIYSLKAYQNDYRREKVVDFSGNTPSGSSGANQYHYRCTNCDTFKTTSQASMIRHIWNHKNKKSFICRQCNQCFDKEFSLYKHKKNNHPEQTSQNRIRASAGHKTKVPTAPVPSGDNLQPPSMPFSGSEEGSMLGHVSFPMHTPQLDLRQLQFLQAEFLKAQNAESIYVASQLAQQAREDSDQDEQKQVNQGEANSAGGGQGVSRRNLLFKHKRKPAHFFNSSEEEDDENL